MSRASDSPFQVVPVPDKNDGRGAAFFVDGEAIAWLGSVRDVHVVAIDPGKVRGNHAHGRREILFVSYDGVVEYAWSARDSDRVVRERAEGQGGFVVLVAPYTLHAFKNAGAGHVQIVSMSDQPHDPADTRYEALLA